MFKLKSFTKQCVRVWRLLKKPAKTEYTTIAKISAIGLGLIGIIGFIISIVMTLLQVALQIK
ncbi:protein translocase SEC61 complex subunit gamma [Candidatus Pacearchaeota archaeon]|nr:protein translocase SEC61 complex subunit gamma [Candidatus Pacearchaeota archaeon]